jgi:hypothetical protein
LCVARGRRPLAVHFLKYLSGGGRWSAVLESVSQLLPVSWEGPETGTIPVDLGATFVSHSRRGCQEAGNESPLWPTLPVIQRSTKNSHLFFFPVLLMSFIKVPLSCTGFRTSFGRNITRLYYDARHMKTIGMELLHVLNRIMPRTHVGQS